MRFAMPVFDSFVNPLDIAEEYNPFAYSEFKSEFVYCSILNRFQFILDSDITIHIYCEKSYFREIKPCNNTKICIKSFNIR